MGREWVKFGYAEDRLNRWHEWEIGLCRLVRLLMRTAAKFNLYLQKPVPESDVFAMFRRAVFLP